MSANESNGATNGKSVDNYPWLQKYKWKPGERPAGRQKGTSNKTTELLKKAILIAAADAGDEIVARVARDAGFTIEEVSAAVEDSGGLIGYLRWLATKHPQTYGALLGKVLPMQIKFGRDAAPGEYETVDQIRQRLADQGLTLECLKLVDGPPVADYVADEDASDDADSGAESRNGGPSAPVSD